VVVETVAPELVPYVFEAVSVTVYDVEEAKPVRV
jgi:hypothetical protein